MAANKSDPKSTVAQSAVTHNYMLPTIESGVPRRVPYPKRVFLILGTEFCERFTYYGMVNILTLYLKRKLGFGSKDATSLFHGFTMMVFLMGIFGSILSDVWLGKFRTIVYLSSVYVIGSVVVATSAVPTISWSPQTVLIIGLLLIAIGSGGIKPCVAAFGGDQFKLPEQATQLATFFSLFYFTINTGSIISSSITPMLKTKVHCFEQEDCYPLAFGVPAVLMVTAIVVFLSGKSIYTYVQVSSENMLVQVIKCVWHAIVTKFRDGRQNPKKNLLDYSIDKYGEQLVTDIRTWMHILVLYIPLPLFWTLYDQRGSRWALQADKMDGRIDWMNYTILPEQISLANPLFVILLIPLFEFVLNPLLAKIGLRRPLQKMVVGMSLAAISFILAALVQFKIEASPNEKTVHILWLLPQYLVLTTGEILFSPVGLGFSYQQAPKSMKSIVSACWALTTALGNLITFILISSLTIFKYQSYEFLLFSGLLFVDMLFFIALAYNYKDRTQQQQQDQSSETEKTKF